MLFGHWLDRLGFLGLRAAFSQTGDGLQAMIEAGPSSFSAARREHVAYAADVDVYAAPRPSSPDHGLADGFQLQWAELGSGRPAIKAAQGPEGSAVTMQLRGGRTIGTAIVEFCMLPELSGQLADRKLRTRHGSLIACPASRQPFCDYSLVAALTLGGAVTAYVRVTTGDSYDGIARRLVPAICRHSNTIRQSAAVRIR